MPAVNDERLKEELVTELVKVDERTMQSTGGTKYEGC